MTEEEKIEFERLDEMEEQMHAEIYIPKEHQQALTIDKDKNSEEKRLIKVDADPPTTTDTTSPKDDLSTLTGLTRESKAKAYADSEVKKVASQYSETIITMQSNVGEEDTRIEELENWRRHYIK